MDTPMCHPMGHPMVPQTVFTLRGSDGVAFTMGLWFLSRPVRGTRSLIFAAIYRKR